MTLSRAALIVALLARGAVAHADPWLEGEPCDAYLGTPSGTEIPTIGSLYYDDPENRPWDATFSQGVGIAFVEHLPGSVHRLAYWGGAGARLDVTVGGTGAHASYRLDAGWQPEAAPRVRQYWRAEVAEAGPRSEDTILLQIDAPVAAVRATWTTARGTRTWLAPPRTSESAPGVSLVELGDDRCHGHALPADEVLGGGTLALVALRADGSRVDILGLPARVVGTEMPLGELGLGRALGTVRHVRALRALAPPPPPLPAGWNPMAGLDDALWLALGGGGLIALGCFGLFRLRPALRDPS